MKQTYTKEEVDIIIGSIDWNRDKAMHCMEDIRYSKERRIQNGLQYFKKAQEQALDILEYYHDYTSLLTEYRDFAFKYNQDKVGREVNLDLIDFKEKKEKEHMIAVLKDLESEVERLEGTSYQEIEGSVQNDKQDMLKQLREDEHTELEVFASKELEGLLASVYKYTEGILKKVDKDPKSMQFKNDLSGLVSDFSSNISAKNYTDLSQNLKNIGNKVEKLQEYVQDNSLENLEKYKELQKNIQISDRIVRNMNRIPKPEESTLRPMPNRKYDKY